MAASKRPRAVTKEGAGAAPAASGGDAADDDRTLVGEKFAPPKRTSRDRAHLIVLAGESLGQMFRVGQPEVAIGRASDANIRLMDEGVSRRHARILVTETELRIEDLGSVNGTLLNGEPIRTAVLHDGDKIQMGSTTVLKFTYSDELEENFRQRMYDAALYDSLTKACNKRHFLHRLQTEVSFAERHQSPLALLMLDIDHFKQVNDGHGHPAGDYVLATLGEIVSAGLRAEDLFARYGGEEFAVLCRGTTAESALALAERLRAKVATYAFEHRRRPIPVTISVGVASWSKLPDSATRFIAHADEALYKAKVTGRNRVVAYPFT